jgi:CDP-diacylglycerol--glycerol-3-phosphate 3-phosphatidyltransferase
MADQTPQPHSTEHASTDAQAAAGPPATLSDHMRRYGKVILDPVGRAIARTGITPNMLTLVGFLLNVGVAVVLATGYIRLGGVLLVLAAGFDALDGTVARLTGQQSTFGAFFDSTLDRFSEAAVYGGLLYYYLDQGARTDVVLIYAVIVGSLMVSYARARAEGLGLECKVGLLTRFERMAILSLGLILNLATLALWVIAIFANLTAVQRIVHVYRVAQAPGGDSRD